MSVARPRPGELAFVYDTCSQLARTGSVTGGQQQPLVELAATLRERDGAAVIVRAGLNLSTLFNVEHAVRTS